MMQQYYRYPLKQHIGAPSEPCVAAGEHVALGQLIASAPQGKLGANLHSGVSGKVFGVTETEIVILADAEQTRKFVPIKGNTTSELVKAAGIVGMGGAGFPTYVKLSSKLKPGGTVIANASECEPILSHNIERIEKEPEKVINGLKYAMEAVDASRGVIAIKSKHTEAIRALRGILASGNSEIEIHPLPDLYPMGEERAVIRETLGILLETDKLPLEANAVVLNSETLCRITEAVELKKPSITKDVTVAGRINGETVKTFFDVPTGTSVEEIIELAGGASAEYGELIMGGPFTGKRTSLDAPITKTSGGVIVAMPFLKEKRPIGLLVCACGADRKRLEEIAASMGAETVAVAYCKQAVETKGGALKCHNPGCCPGQAERVLRLKKAGAQALLISNCTDCTNTVMTIAPKLGLPVYHCTDGALRSVNLPLVRKMKLNDLL